MSKIMICVPTLDRVDASFFTSVLALKYDGEHRYAWNVKSNSLVYDARNEMALEAINGGYDVMVSLDSDLVLEPETLLNLVAGIEAGNDFVTGLYFMRRLPTKPLILKELDWYEDEVLGAQESAEVYEDYPRDSVFEIAGCGFGCCIMSVEMVKHMTVAYRMNPFTPMPRLSEDYSFCWRARKLGYRLWCDSRIRPGHAGLKVYGEADWDRQMEAEDDKA